MATLAVKASPHVSWRRTWIGGAVAVGAFAALVLGFMVMRALGIGSVGSLMAKGAFGKKETVVVADFTSPPSDSTLGVTVSEALRTDLEQSSNLTVLTKASVAEVLTGSCEETRRRTRALRPRSRGGESRGGQSGAGWLDRAAREQLRHLREAGQRARRDGAGPVPRDREEPGRSRRRRRRPVERHPRQSGRVAAETFASRCRSNG